jgi:quercetin dioxygenase-like cupin family protein
MSKLEALPAEALSETPSTLGLTRHMAFKDDHHIVIRSRAEPGIVSGWHHHGDYDVYGYVVSGTACFENAADEKDAITVGPGDFFHVPLHTIHRESNPSPEESGEVILFLRGSGPLVVNTCQIHTHVQAAFQPITAAVCVWRWR